MNTHRVCKERTAVIAQLDQEGWTLKQILEYARRAGWTSYGRDRIYALRNRARLQRGAKR